MSGMLLKLLYFFYNAYMCYDEKQRLFDWTVNTKLDRSQIKCFWTPNYLVQWCDMTLVIHGAGKKENIFILNLLQVKD